MVNIVSTPHMFRPSNTSEGKRAADRWSKPGSEVASMIAIQGITITVGVIPFLWVLRAKEQDQVLSTPRAAFWLHSRATALSHPWMRRGRRLL
jgi:hypothetical protein